MDTSESRTRLTGMASAAPWRDGFHQVSGDTMAVELEVGQILYGAVRDVKPEYVVEFGTHKGYSAAWILAGLCENERGVLHTCDLVPADRPLWDQVGIPDLSRLAYSPNTPVREMPLPPRIDLLFHDAGHGFDEVIGDIERCLPLIPKGGIILVHDVAHSRAMGDALAAWFDARPDDWRYAELTMGAGLGKAERTSEPAVESRHANAKAPSARQKRRNVVSPRRNGKRPQKRKAGVST